MTLFVPKGATIHASALPYGTAVGIHRYHTKPAEEGGRGWDDIGYHFVISNGQLSKNGDMLPEFDGMVWPGRDLDDDPTTYEVGAHAYGHNHSFGICLIGPEFTERQIKRAHVLTATLIHQYALGVETVLGHRETPYQMLKPAGNRTLCPDRLDMHVFRGNVRDRLQDIEFSLSCLPGV